MGHWRPGYFWEAPIYCHDFCFMAYSRPRQAGDAHSRSHPGIPNARNPNPPKYMTWN